VDEKDSMGSDDRIAQDRYQEANGETVIIAERITTESSDGQRFPDRMLGQYLAAI